LTPKQQADKINAFIAGFDDLVNDTFTKAIYNLEGDIRERIFQENLDVFGQSLGQYSTKSAYFTREQFVNKGAFRAQGKGEHLVGQKRKTYKKTDSYTGKSISQAYKSDLTDRTSMYLQNGYKELRAIQGKEIGIVDLTYSGILKLSGTNVEISDGSYKIKLSNELSIDKARGFEKKRRKRVFYASKQEQDNALKYIYTTLAKPIKKVFGNV